jgi:diamine N-acetyltransferase
MLGPPTFPETPPPTWEQFVADFGPHFFDGSRPEVEASYIIETDGEAVGQVNYEIGETPAAGRFAELDIWLRAEADTGRGYGSQALDLLVRRLAERFALRTFVIRPSERNPRAIRAYEKAGFVRRPMPAEEQAARFGPGDYPDTVVMIREMTG